MPTIWKRIRPHLAAYKKSLVNRPVGLRRLGKNSFVIRPWRIDGRECIEVGNDCTVMSDCNIRAVRAPGEGSRVPAIRFGDNVYVGHHSCIVAMDGVYLGDGCVVSDYVYINDSNHGIDPLQGLIMQQATFTKGPVTIGANCFLGYRAIVMSGVTLGEWCIIGANTVVTRSFPPYSMVAGSPARIIRQYSREQRTWMGA